MKLVGGMWYLHEKKAEKSYFGGRIESYRVVETDAAHSRRVIFTVTSMREGKDVPWRDSSFQPKPLMIPRFGYLAVSARPFA